jgi:hypothetical protein
VVVETPDGNLDEDMRQFNGGDDLRTRLDEDERDARCFR